MATGMVSAAFSVVSKALSPLTESLFKDWAASVELGSNVDALELELLTVKTLLEHALGREIRNSGLEKLLVQLQELGYDAEDVLDELDYFRIQDQLDGTSEAADRHAKGCAHNLVLNAKAAVGKHIVCLPACLPANREVKAKLNSRAFGNTCHAVIGKCFPCSSLPPVRDADDDDNSMHSSSPQRNRTNEPPKLRFNRVDASKRMRHIAEKLQHVRENVSSIIATIGSGWSAVTNIEQSRPITTSESIVPKLYGRDRMMKSIIDDITEGKLSTEVLTVIPIVGPGGIGKTTLAQHIYHNAKVQQHFEVKIWTCVSLSFSANKLIENIQKDRFFGPSFQGDSLGELIRERLKNKRFLLVLDDMWDCSNEDEWKRLLLPFEKSQVHGNIILVTTRFPAHAQMVKTTDHSIYLKGLDHEAFSDLFQEIVFGSDQCKKDHKFLLETGNKIAARLKGSPLAAKTVGRLLKSQLDLVHWTRVLENKEWEQEDGNNDIMPALKLSYDYLPLHLKQCFYYCALFPQDYKFKREELINFWIGLDVLHSSCGENKRVEDIGQSHLIELVNHGFFEKEEKEDGDTCYIIHDLLHELALKVSSHECISIDSSQHQVSSLHIPTSVRHLSINIDDTSVKGRSSLRNCVEDFNKLGTTGLKVKKLRTMMLFGEYHGFLVKAFGDLFREAKAFRVIILSKASYYAEDLLRNFYNLVHLRYLRIEGSSVLQPRFPNKISRFYHMMVLDAKRCDYITNLPRDMSNLVKLRHFLVSDDETHASIVKVGELKSLQELRRFVVKQEGQDFELRQLGHLIELCGSLCIENLENVQVKEEADEAKLMQKGHLNELILRWNVVGSTNETTLEEHVLERLQPSSNLLKLSIIGHRGATCPSWLGINLSVKSLESLCLHSVAWETFPPIGELWLLNNVPCEQISGKIPDKRFENLRRLELENIRWLKNWVVHAPCQLLPFLEVLIIRDCFELEELSFSHSGCCQQEKEVYANLFPRLSGLVIQSCPRLLSFPPVPWTEAPCSIEIGGTRCSCFYGLSLSEYNLRIIGKGTGSSCTHDYSSEYSLETEGEDTPNSTYWNVLAFHSQSKLKGLDMTDCHPLPLHHLQMLSSLRTLRLSFGASNNAFPFVEGDGHAEFQFPVELVHIEQWIASGKELTRLLTYFPKLSNLRLFNCHNITELGVMVMGQNATATHGASSSVNKADDAQIEQDITGAQEEEIVTLVAEGLLLLPLQLKELEIKYCPELILRSNPLDNNKEYGRRTGGRRGLQGLSSLERLEIMDCPKLLSSYSSSSLSSCFLFPNSLQHLSLHGLEIGMVPLSNLISLRSLSIFCCKDLRGEGLFPLLALGHLTNLRIELSPDFFIDCSRTSQVLPSRSSKLEDLIIQDVAGFTAAPICSLLFNALTTLEIRDEELECFTKEQEVLLFVNSLKVISFRSCNKLQCLPRLHTLPSVKRLNIWKCRGIRMLTEGCLPSSLQELSISNCREIRSLPKNGLPSSLQKLVIESCPALQSLPRAEDLPCSLRSLYVRGSISEELRRQCRKLIGTIPTVDLEEARPWVPCGAVLKRSDSESKSSTVENLEPKS